MRKIAAYSLGFIGFLMQGSAVVGLPVYVLFFGGSSLWLLAFFPLGFAGMFPLTMMKAMLDSGPELDQQQPREVLDTISEIDNFLSSHAEFCRDSVRDETVALANIVDKTVNAIRINGASPKQLALILITNVLSRHLASGRHHVYRGVLGTLGNDMFNLFSTAASVMRNHGYCSEEEFQESMSLIKSQIAEMG